MLVNSWKLMFTCTCFIISHFNNSVSCSEALPASTMYNTIKKQNRFLDQCQQQCYTKMDSLCLSKELVGTFSRLRWYPFMTISSPIFMRVPSLQKLIPRCIERLGDDKTPSWILWESVIGACKCLHGLCLLFVVSWHRPSFSFNLLALKRSWRDLMYSFSTGFDLAQWEMGGIRQSEHGIL